METKHINRHLVLESHSQVSYQPDLRHTLSLTRVETQIFDFLIKQLKKKTKYCKEKDGTLWIRCTKKNVAKMVDCSLSTVTRAYKKFRELGFLIVEQFDSWTGNCRSWISMQWDRLKELLPFSDFKIPRYVAENMAQSTPPPEVILTLPSGHFDSITHIYNNDTIEEDKEDPKMDPLPNDEISSSSSSENRSPVKYMTDTWNEMAVRIKTQTVDYDYLDEKDYQNALAAYEEYGQKGWDDILTIYECSRFLRGKTEKGGASPFTFHAVVNPKIIGRIRGGNYSGGLEEYNKIVEASKTEKESTIMLKDLIFEGEYAMQRKSLAESIGAPTYMSLIINGNVQFSLYGDVLRLDCSQFVYDKLELLHRRRLLKAFHVNNMERRFSFDD